MSSLIILLNGLHIPPQWKLFIVYTVLQERQLIPYRKKDNLYCTARRTTYTVPQERQLLPSRKNDNSGFWESAIGTCYMTQWDSLADNGSSYDYNLLANMTIPNLAKHSPNIYHDKITNARKNSCYQNNKKAAVHLNINNNKQKWNTVHHYIMFARFLFSENMFTTSQLYFSDLWIRRKRFLFLHIWLVCIFRWQT